MADSAHFKDVLDARLAELGARLREIDGELDSHQSRDWEDLAVEREEEEVLERLGASGLAEIDTIRAALHRISDGSFGTCVTCGNEIARERLDTLPATPFCRHCAR